jgi:hypothetical protein
MISATIRRGQSRPLLGCLALLASWGCVSNTPDPNKEAIAEELNAVASELFVDLIVEKSRLLDMQYRLNLARAESCESVARPQFGVLTGSSSTLDEDYLKEVAARDGIVAEALTIVHVVSGSPFGAAGMRVGDEILEINAQIVESHSQLVELRMRSTTATSTRVRFLRDQEEMTLEIPVETACPTIFQLAASESLLTRSNRAVIQVPRGLVAYAQDDDLLAAALAHGMAHALFDREDQTHFQNEERADSLGIETAAMAGFDVSPTIGYWEDIARAYPYFVLPHPTERVKSRDRRITTLIEGWGRQPHYEIAKRFPGIRHYVKRHSARYPRQ